MGERCRWCDEDVSAGQDGICCDCGKLAADCFSCGEETLDDTGHPECVGCMSKRIRRSGGAGFVEAGLEDAHHARRKGEA